LVKFDLGQNESGTCAINVRPEIESRLSVGRELGYIQKVMGSYGFIVTTDGRQYYINQNEFLDGRELTQDFVGAGVEFTGREVPGKTPAAHSVRLVRRSPEKSAAAL
jgi:hypothetical protein